ncbi:MAG: tetratricopeptide repeat protein, partial [Rhizobiaceae bacterium]|nr:tetratricopeptide repeat protein [Rhizobiaceae bacterium]
MLYAGSGKPAEARDAAFFILEKNPADTDAPVILAEIATQPRELAETRARLQALPPTASILSALALLDMRERKVPAAKALLQRALELDPKSHIALVTQARLNWAGKEIDLADKNFAAAVALAPARSTLRLQYARFKLQNGQTDAAKAILDESIAKVPDYLPAYLLRATIATSEKKHEESVALYEQVLQRDPENLDALLWSGQERLALGANEKAIATLERAVATFGNSWQSHFHLGNAYLAAGDLNRAAASLTEAIKLAPAGTPGPIVSLARVNLRQGSYGPAVNALKPLVDKQPNNAEAKLLLAEGYQKQGNFEAALAIYRPLIEASPQSVQLHFLIGNLFVQQGQSEQARQAFTNVLELSPAFVPALEQLVRIEVEAKQIGAAKARVESFTVANPKEAAGFVMLAQIALIENDRKTAEANLVKAIELRPEQTPPYMALAQLQLGANRITDAVATLRQATVKAPNFPGAYILLGVLLEQQKDYAAARTSYEKAVELDGKSADALNNLAYLLSERFGEIDKAVELAQRARDVQPGNPAVADTLGWLLYKKKQYARAVILLDESAAKLPRSGEARYHAGMAHYMVGNEAAARTALREALVLESSFSGSDDARQSLAVLELDIAKQGEAARAQVEKVLAARPDDPVALVRLGALNERSGKLDQALATYENILKANPSNVSAALNLIRVLRTRKEPAKALEIAKATRRLAPADGRLGHVFGRLSYENGEYASAITALQEALRRLDGDPEVGFD